jgi:hypothetical protein
MNEKHVKILLALPLAFLCVGIAACSNNSPENRITEPLTPLEAGNSQTQLLGGDRDEHGCIGSAGYSWCEARQKCLRPWEEQCVSTEPADPTTEPVETREPATVETTADEAGIKAAFAKKYDKSESEITLTNPQITSNFARGGVRFGTDAGGGLFLAVKRDGEWILAFDGNGAADCNEMETYGFPSAMLEGICY